MKLRSYQEECINTILNSLLQGENPLLVTLATGSGKTIIFSALIQKIAERYDIDKFRCLIVCHKNILIEQTVDKLLNFVDNVGIYNAGLKKRELNNQITVGSIQSLIKAKELPKINLLIFDECHRSNMDKESSFSMLYYKLQLNNPIIKLLGVTATPFTVNKYIYGDNKFWNKPIYEKGIKSLVDEGHLCPVIIRPSKEKLDLSKVKMVAGDYCVGDLTKEILSQEQVVLKQIEDALTRSYYRKKVIWLTVSIDHAEYIHSKVKNSVIIHSKKKDNLEDINNFKSYPEYKHLISVLIASEGFDYPEADCLVLMRPTRSPVLYIQGTGRILRTASNKENGLLLDYGNVIENLGHVYDVKIKEKKNDPDPITNLCIECSAAIPREEKKCPDCGAPVMIVCGGCGEMKQLGEKCENGCKIVRNPCENLTLESYSGSEKNYQIDSIEFSYHKSKSGNKCICVGLYKGFNRVFAEYVVVDPSKYFFRKRLKKIVERYTQENKAIGFYDFCSKMKCNTITKKEVTAITVAKIKKYNEVIEVFYKE